MRKLVIASIALLSCWALSSCGEDAPVNFSPSNQSQQNSLCTSRSMSVDSIHKACWDFKKGDISQLTIDIKHKFPNAVPSGFDAFKTSDFLLTESWYCMQHPTYYQWCFYFSKPVVVLGGFTGCQSVKNWDTWFGEQAKFSPGVIDKAFAAVPQADSYSLVIKKNELYVVPMSNDPAKSAEDIMTCLETHFFPS